MYLFLIIFNPLNAITDKYTELKRYQMFFTQDAKFGTYSQVNSNVIDSLYNIFRLSDLLILEEQNYGENIYKRK